VLVIPSWSRACWRRRGHIWLKERDTGVCIILQYIGGTLKFLSEDLDAELVNNTAKIMGGLERVLDANEMPVVSNTSCPVLHVLTERNAKWMKKTISQATLCSTMEYERRKFVLLIE
jgi:hypothetical protein